MADIQIVFPEGGGAPILNRLSHAALESEMITWDITSYNEKIKEVVIEFVDRDGQGPPAFFQTSKGPSHRIEKQLGYWDRFNDEGEPIGKIARREAYGTAPRLTQPGHEICKTRKYNVVANLAQGAPIILDPDIVIARP